MCLLIHRTSSRSRVGPALVIMMLIAARTLASQQPPAPKLWVPGQNL